MRLSVRLSNCMDTGLEIIKCAKRKLSILIIVYLAFRERMQKCRLIERTDHHSFAKGIRKVTY